MTPTHAPDTPTTALANETPADSSPAHSTQAHSARANRAMGPAYRRLFDELDRMANPIDIDRGLFRALLSAVPADEPWIHAAAAFSDFGYRRNRVRWSAGYEALLMCWRPGQSSPIHDHAGSLCGVRVLRGIATETRYEPGACGEPTPTRRVQHGPGAVCIAFDDQTHRISNEQEGESDLLTLHLYLPPLRSMRSMSAWDPLVARRRPGPGYAWGEGI